jgi:hypothetical protein
MATMSVAMVALSVDVRNALQSPGVLKPRSWEVEKRTKKAATGTTR